jgi:hypothetical protein
MPAAWRPAWPLGKLAAGVTVLPPSVLLFAVLTACAVGPHLANETSSGGTVVYPFTEEKDILSSNARRDALRLMNDKCPSGYRVKTEGELAKVRKNIDQVWSGQISAGRVWGIEFLCK